MEVITKTGLDVFLSQSYLQSLRLPSQISTTVVFFSYTYQGWTGDTRWSKNVSKRNQQSCKVVRTKF